jgi:hypothetical protein
VTLPTFVAGRTIVVAVAMLISAAGARRTDGEVDGGSEDAVAGYSSSANSSINVSISPTRMPRQAKERPLVPYFAKRLAPSGIPKLTEHPPFRSSKSWMRRVS